MGEPVPGDHVIVLFGATGDLAARKLLPGFFELTQAGLMPRDFRVIGTAPVEMSDDDFVAHVRDVVGKFGRVPATGEAWDTFIGRVGYVASSADDARDLAKAVEAAAGELGAGAEVLLYLSIPPAAMDEIVGAIGDAGLGARGAKVILEKPFGTDVDSAKALNARLHSVFAEEQIFRIDHFLGKEDVQDILAFRFANRLFEPIWSAEHVAEIQIDVPETLGVENRAKFYDATGAFRDMVVTHLFQALGFVTMEPPAAFSADALATEKQRAFGALQPLDPAKVVRGQYDGYRALPDVPDDSDTETMVAVEARIDNARWDGVPIHLRTGKRLPVGARVITLNLRKPPLDMFPTGATCHGNRLVFEIGEPGSIRIDFQAKEPGPAMTLGGAHMDFVYKSSFDPRRELEAYERLLHDAMLGDRTLFTRAEGIERLWEVAAPLLAAPPPVQPYAQGTWGPAAADALVAPQAWQLTEATAARA
ncbi:MAG: glucose-6-phosphate dehydrogenase [Solirubrobacteraceae bacterium]